MAAGVAEHHVLPAGRTAVRAAGPLAVAVKLFGKKILTEAQQSLTFSRRAVLVSSAQMGMGALLATRMGWIAIAENEKYSLLSESNRVNLTLIPPRRGWIVDRKGIPLANNRTDFRVDIIPDRLRDGDRGRVVELLTQLLALRPEEVDRINESLEKAAGFQPVQVADGLDYAKYAAVSVRLSELPGVAPSQGFSRFYPAGPSVGHLIGYVGGASAKEYEKTRDPLLITPGFKVGKQGLEQFYDGPLTGKPGARRVEVTARGRIVRDLATRPDVAGKTVKLTIDAGLQDYAGRRMGTQSGAVVVMDCSTGDVLASASMPSFDPNSFSDGISHLEWEMLSKDDHVPLRNKALQGLYPPGSTVKPMVALSFLEHGLDPDEHVGCTGAVRVGNTLFHCWKRGGHGAINMGRAIAQSCDIYFYVMAQRFGMDVIADMARRLGLGQKYDLPFPSQSYGTVPDPAWKQKKYNQPWAIYDTVNATIGQGYMLVNPTQMAVMASRLASGRALVPHFLADGKRHDAPPLGVRQENLDLIHTAMSNVINGGGTGGAARLPVPGVLMAGKTGTAQVRRITMAERSRGVRGNSSLPFKLRDHALLQCFAPFDKPRYALGCILEHNGHVTRIMDSTTISSDIMSYLFDPAGAMERLEKLEKEWGGTPQQRLEKQIVAYRIEKGVAAAATETANAAGTGAANDSAPVNTAEDEQEAERPAPTPAAAGASTGAAAPAATASPAAAALPGAAANASTPRP
ncbi:penicillin-binding protein 2 [Sphingobium sufflavum]|uniref:penicillin-binding protein 2 n=1 Tax=Sphingobium sufflavum TaxID=1129547 RepID=UPI001F337671|nr:penicillin-binding protein 2 [Sphingobium sufflavum]MCE7796035.1 penicillin-binding protein 2 [Sphingobium sufflavum]